MTPPKYYDQQLEKLQPELLEEIKLKRKKEAKKRKEDNTWQRLEDQEKVINSRLNLKRRDSI